MRFVHSSDLQIGKTFGFFDLDIASLLQNERHAVLNRLGEIAIQHEAPTVLLAGDIFDKQQLSNITIKKPLEIMRRFAGVTWHLLPGNHDHFRENGLWERVVRQLPANVRLHTTPGAVKIADDMPAYLLPAPLRYISSSDDLTSYMDSETTPDGAIRIGVAHGSVRGFGSEGEASNYISPTRAETAGLAYMALGDWHRQMKITTTSGIRERRNLTRSSCRQIRPAPCATVVRHSSSSLPVRAPSRPSHRSKPAGIAGIA